MPLRVGLGLDYLILVPLLICIPRSRSLAAAASAAAALPLSTWAWGDTLVDSGPAALRAQHLSVISLWLGDALFDLRPAVPAGVKHAEINAVIAGARHREGIRWILRFSPPTVILTTILMALHFGSRASNVWHNDPGLIVPLEIGLILALVASFSTNALYRTGSPVREVRKLDRLYGAA